MMLKKFGRRGAVLALVGAMQLLFGVILVLHSPAPNPNDAVLFEYLPIMARSSLWVSYGVVALVCSMRREWQKWGWAAAVLMPAQRAIAYLWSAVMWVVPGPPPGRLGSVLESLVWAMVTVTLVLASSWLEDSPPIPVERRHT